MVSGKKIKKNSIITVKEMIEKHVLYSSTLMIDLAWTFGGHLSLFIIYCSYYLLYYHAMPLAVLVTGNNLSFMLKITVVASVVHIFGETN